jgi:PAS domain S-box-containing protein
MRTSSSLSYWHLYTNYVRRVILPGHDSATKDMPYWRDELFCNILSYITPLSIIALVPSIYMSFRAGYNVVVMADILVFACVVAIMLLPGLKLSLRKGIFISIIYCLSAILLYYLAWPAPGLMFLLTMTVFIATIYSSSAAYYSVWANTAICVAMGLLIYSKRDIHIVSEGSIGGWIAVSSNFVLLSFVCVKCLDQLLGGLEKYINDIKTTKQGLKLEKEKYELLFEHNLDGILLSAADGRVLDANPAALDMIGMTADEARHTCRQDMMDMTDPRVVQARDQRIQAGRARGEIRVVKKNKQTFEAEFASSQYTDSTGEVRTIHVFRDITERKKTGEALKESEAFNKGILTSLKKHIAVIDTTGNIIAVNKAWEDFSKNNGEANLARTSVGSNYFEVCRRSIAGGNDIAACALAGILSVVNHEKLFFEMDYPCHSPTEHRWFTLRAAPFDGDGSRVVISHQNITARKIAEVERDVFFNLSLDLMGIAGPDGHFRRASPSFEKTLGYTADELFSQPFIYFVHDDDKLSTALELEKLSHGIPTVGFINRYRCKDQSYIWLEWNAEPMEENIYWTARNITERKKTEESIKQSEANLTAIIENSDVSIYSIDTDMRYITFNSLMSNNIKLSYGVDIRKGDKVYGFLESMNAAESREWFDIYTMALSGKRLEFEKDYSTDDKPGHICFTINPILESGKVIGLSCFARDITKEKLAEIKIRELNATLEKKVKERTAELKHANNELETFSYTVSHDLQSPLRVMSGYAKILLEDYGDKIDEEGKKYLNFVDNSAKHMGELIRALLAFAKLGNDTISKSNASMNNIVAMVIEGIKHADTSFKTEIIVHDLGTISCDAALMHQVWTNLIGNAVKYSIKKDKPLVEIGRQKINNEEVYYIKDNGAGFEMKYAAKLFGIFQRLHGIDEFEGTGVGLATVHRIIERHGGRIWAEAAPGLGATFYFTIPQ